MRRKGVHPLVKRINCFKNRSKGDYRNVAKKSSHTIQFGIKEVLEKLGEKPVCYLTGRQLDYDKKEEWALDHIIPISQNGSNNLDNSQITHRAANQAKHELSVEDFIQLCKEVLEYNGYTVT